MTDLQAATTLPPPRWSLPNSLFPSVGRRLTLGLGLIGIGKPWGHTNDSVPDEASVRQLLETAFSLGIRYFDTAPSYGVSEQRFSSFLCSLTPTQRASLTIATKFGEHWDAAGQQPFVDHSYDALFRSLDESLQRLGKIDILQLHKTTAAALRSSDLQRAFRHAQSLGIRNLGASVSDLESTAVALDLQSLSVLQLPLNPSSRQFHEVVRQATDAGILVVTNRPFAMGSLLYAEQPITKHAAFNFLNRSAFDGVVLTGTKSAEHLHENWTAFHQAVLYEPTL
jgi:aryl-alcohol dehydrogenase-like predicted oxidoreductase